MLVSVCSQYPFPERLIADQLDQLVEPPTPVTLNDAESVRKWIDAVREVANPIRDAAAPRTNTLWELFHTIGKGQLDADEVQEEYLLGPHRSEGPDADLLQKLFETRPHNVGFSLLTRIIQVSGLAKEAERRLDTLARIEALMPPVWVRLLALAVGTTAFVSGVLVPLVDPNASSLWSGWIPVAVYCAGLATALAFSVRWMIKHI